MRRLKNKNILNAKNYNLIPYLHAYIIKRIITEVNFKKYNWQNLLEIFDSNKFH